MYKEQEEPKERDDVTEEALLVMRMVLTLVENAKLCQKHVKDEDSQFWEGVKDFV